MTDINHVLAEAGIKTALIVDDAYDDAPKASDLSLESEAWTPFFQDLSKPDEDLLTAAYPQYHVIDDQELIASDDFIKILWGLKDNINPVVIGPIFDSYQADRNAELIRLDSLAELLTSYGLSVEKSGRVFSNSANSAHLIVIDLFLGRSQRGSDAELSINGLRQVIESRKEKPPLVMLMSSNDQLPAKQLEFKNKAGLYESAFRFIKKSEINTTANFQILLMRLARHYATSLLLINFVNSWEISLKKSITEVTGLIRKLDLVDIAYIKKLLLDEEKESTGAYLVDIFDKALQYSNEGQDELILAAKALNGFAAENYPPPYLPVSPDLHALVFQTHFQNLKRSTIHEGCRHKLGLGDFFSVSPAKRQHPNLFGLHEKNVLVALNPACDLARPESGAKNILFMVGELHLFTQTDWIEWEDSEIRTTVVEMEDGKKYWIKWSHKNIRTLSWTIFERLIASSKIKFIARARETHALELQQKLLANLGRVGLIAPMPATFPTEIKIYLPDVDGKLIQLPIPELNSAGGTCYIDKGKKTESNIHLVICETTCEAILKAITAYDTEQIHPDSLEAVNYLKTTSELRLLGNGVRLNSKKTQPQKILSSSDKTKIIGLIYRNIDENTRLTRHEFKNAGIVIYIPIL